MSYGYSPAFQRVPNSNPHIPASIRPPIHNPYDTFTQPQFDEWVGGITSALRKALGKEEEEVLTSQPAKSREGDAHPVSDTDEDDVEDSFAEWKAMRAKEKGKMRATEDEQDSEYGDTQEIYEDFGAEDHAAGNTPDDAIELLSDDDGAEGEELNAHRECDDRGRGGGSVESFSSVGSDEEADHPYFGASQPTSPPAPYVSANTTGQQAIEISDGETESHNQADDPFEAESLFFGFGQGEQGECQQPPDIRDPWELPKTYAEDLYTGGPIRELDHSKLSPSHLTPSPEEADHTGNVDPQLRPSSILAPQSTDHSFAEISQGPATLAQIPPTPGQVSNSDDEVSLYGGDVPELDIPMGTILRPESEFVSFTALNQTSDVESERGGPEVLYISDNDGGGVSEDDKEVEEDEFDSDGLVPLGTSDLEIPAERGLEEDGDGVEELDELEDDGKPLAHVPSNPPYGYYGLDASSVTGSGGVDDETAIVGPPTNPIKGVQNEVSGMVMSQKSPSLLDPHNLAPLPAAATFIDIDHQSQHEASAVVDDATKVSLAEVSFTFFDGTPTTPGEVVIGVEDPGAADEDSVGDDTILADGAVLTANEVEEVLRGAFAETDRLVPAPNFPEGITPGSDTAPSFWERDTCTSSKPNQSDVAPGLSSGPPHERTIKDEDHLAGSPPRTFNNEPSSLREEQKNSLPFIMPLVANPNVRDPTSATRSPVQSGPSTPVVNPAYLPAVTKFKRDNQLLGVTHSSSGLFTPLEGSGSSSPSPSDTATPEDRPNMEVETEIPVVDDDERHREGSTTSMVAPPTNGSPDIQDVESNAAPTNLPEDGDWEEVPRLSMPPDEVADHAEPTLTAVPATRVFFQPGEPSDRVEGFDAQGKADSGDDVPDDGDLPHKSKQCQDTQGLHNPKHLVRPSDDIAKDLLEITETGDHFKPTGDNNTVNSGVTADDDDLSSLSSYSSDEKTPRLKVSEIPVLVAEDSSRTREYSDILAGARKSLRKRKRSSSPIRPEPSESGCSDKCKAPNVVTTPLDNGEYGEASHELVEEELRYKEDEHDYDNESFTSSLIAPRGADPSSQDGSRESSVVSEQPLLRGHTPVPEDAPVFHGHGKFKAALQNIIQLRQKPENRVQKPEREKERAKEKVQEKERPVGVKTGSGTPPESGPRNSTEATKPPPLVLPAASTQLSLPSTSASQSPMTPTSELPSSPTIIAAPAEVTTPPQQDQAAQGPTEPDRELTKKPAVKIVKRTTSRKSFFFEPKSTRSQCRYHKISLPREEDGPRVTFCVPQCSLNDKELMEEEDITDDGLATVRDFELLWDHVEDQNLSPYLIGVIRQLVGLDLLRENEVYYLPTDEEIKQAERKRKREERRKSRKKSIGGTANLESTSLTGSVSATGPTPHPSLSQVEKGKLGPPPSSVSTASTRSKVEKGGSTRSVLGDEITDGERNGRKKRRRTGKERDGGSLRNTPSVGEESAGPSTTGSPAPSQSTMERTPARRSRRVLKKAISTEAQAYKPALSSGESSEDELEKTKRTRKSARGGAKGLKRRRTEGTGDLSILSTTGGAGDHDGPLSPRSTRSKRTKIDEK